MNQRKQIANKIKAARIELGISQSTLADLLHQERSSISYIERGKIGIAADRLIDFSKALKKPIVYFLSDIE